MFEDVYKAVKDLPTYELAIGVIAGTTERDDEDSKKSRKKKKKTKEEESHELTNAEIMFINENGSPLRHIPRRPVLQMTIQHARKSMLIPARRKALHAFFDSGFDERQLEIVLKQLGENMASYAQDIIMLNDGRLKGNARRTIEAKGFDHPLFVTGQLAKSITYQLTKKK